MLTKRLGGCAAAIVLIAVEFWLIHAGNDALAATILSISTGFLVVMYQISSQAKNAIKHSRENEALKLKLEVYKDIIGISREDSDAIGELSSFIRKFHFSLLMARQTQAELGGFVIPSAHPSQLIEKKSQIASSAIKVMAATATWQIIDPRMDIFRIAIVTALHDLESAQRPYFNAAYHATTIAFPKDAWTPPTEEVLHQIGALGDTLINSLMTLQSYIFDFLREMQTLLVGPLFDQRIAPRAPLSSSSTVVRLDRYAELLAYFNEQTEWGRSQARTENEIRARGNMTG